jgi:hypothetical protein
MLILAVLTMTYIIACGLMAIVGACWLSVKESLAGEEVICMKRKKNEF